jgi:membrane protease YdiL (CAAX protease family)
MTIATDTLPVPRYARVALLLGGAAALSVLMLLPYALTTMPEAMMRRLPPWPVFATLEFVQSFAIFALAAWGGLRVGYRYGLDAPLLRRLLGEQSTKTVATNWPLSIVLGCVVGATCVAVAVLLPITPAGAAAPGWWKGLLASFYGAIGEEVLCRLFLVTFFVWAGVRLLRRASPSTTIYVTAIVLAALLFGAGHLPQLAAVSGGLHAGAAIEVVALNALCGLVFGWLFWRRGLEHAMLAHFSADLVLHVAAPLVVT